MAQDTGEFAARVAAALYAGGALLTLVVISAPHPPGLDERSFYALAAGCGAAALLLYAGARRIPGWAPPLASALGTVLVSLAVYFSGESHGSPATDVEVLYVWVALYSAYFLERRQAWLQLALMAAGYCGVLVAVAEPSAIATRWSQTVVTLAVAAALVQVLKQRVAGLVARLTNAAHTDPLTGLLNRRSFEELMQREVDRAWRTERPLSLLVGDIDDFKGLNDHLGHPAGDAALVRVAQMLSHYRRRSDAVARTGGEEFALILPETEANQAYAIAERLRMTVERAFAPKPVPLTFSFGVATFPEHAPTPRSLLVAADRALYAAKEMGRNLSVIFSDEVASIVGPEARARRTDAEVHLSTLMSLAEALDQRDMGTAEHCQAVGRYSALIAEELGLPPARVARVRIAGVLHDVGKIGLPDAILQKPDGLTTEEWEKVRKHPEIGAGILASRNFDDIRAWVLAHHERPDGRGYPRGLRGPQIPLEARILAVADTYEAMTADRPYRDALSHEDARAELLGRAGTKFDARVVSALLAALEREPARAPLRAPRS